MFCFIHETVLRIGGKILSGKIDLLEFVPIYWSKIIRLRLVIFLTLSLDKLLCNKLLYNLNIFPTKFHHL
jgi:hypothetical protein